MVELRQEAPLVVVKFRSQEANLAEGPSSKCLAYGKSKGLLDVSQRHKVLNSRSLGLSPRSVPALQEIYC